MSGGIFISHSSRNNAEAERLRDWLEEQGWGRSQVFLDIQDLKSGDKWRDVLNGMSDCEAMIVCLSNEWLGSDECKREFTQAEERGKPIFPLFVAPVTVPIPRFITDVQIGDISPDGFTKLRANLLAKRIAPQSFPWPPKDEPNRAVYRGLQALDVQDAAIFFGRDADVSRGLDELRRLRSGGPQRVLVILGASGAGKSSFLRAGLIARLKRDESFLVLPLVRPERAVISGAQGLEASVSTALGRTVSLAGGVNALTQAFADLRKPIIESLSRTADVAGEIHSSTPPTVIIPVDQAEELFGADNTERAAFCELLAQTVAADNNTIIVATIRSDSYESFQNEPLLAGLPRLPFDLSPIAAGSFQEVIEGPARLAKPPLIVEPTLTQKLLSDLDAADALPLLAFTLERLQSQYAQHGKLTLVAYRDKLGGIAGAIQSAVNSVLGEQPSQEDLAIARRLFVPALVQVDQDGVKRRVARRDDIPAEAKTLAERFVDQRILVTNNETIEVAHEAILRQWPALVGWIADATNALREIDSFERAAREWSANQRRQEWVNHTGHRYLLLEELIDQLQVRNRFDDAQLKYLSACRRTALHLLAEDAQRFPQFKWPPPSEPHRSLYRGTEVFTELDAAVFFGRDAEIKNGLDLLRRLQANAGSERMVVILGASGVGKSSLLRAGLIARLQRDTSNFVVLPLIYGQRFPISGPSGLVAGLTNACSRPVSLANGTADLVATLSDIRRRSVERVRAAPSPPPVLDPTIILPIDQAELLLDSDWTERRSFWEMIVGAIREDQNTLVLITSRSDGYDRIVQAEPLLSECKSTFYHVMPLAPASFQEVIEGPARMANPPIAFERGLTERLLADLDGADALPLLAFTLQRISAQHRESGVMRLTDYIELGGLSGAIVSAVNAALGPSPSKEVLDKVRRLFLPALVQLDQDGGIRRRTARLEDIPQTLRALVDQLVQQRVLVAHGGSDGGSSIEVAHESLFRQWPPLAAWLAEERVMLLVIEGVRFAASEWQANSAKSKWLIHSGARLKSAEAYAKRPEVAPMFLESQSRLYLDACRQAERGATVRSLGTHVLIAVLMLAIGALLGASGRSHKSFHAFSLASTPSH